MTLTTHQPDYWEQRYQEGTTHWDLGEAAPPLREWLLTNPELPRGPTIVLGSGRGYDAVLFAQHGFDVVAVDFAPSAIAATQALAAANQVSVQLLQRNIFDLVPEFTSCFDYVVEHTCFCAIDPSQRHQYVDLVRSLLRAGGYLLGLFFTHDRPGGPPFGSTPEELRQYFTPSFEILSLDPAHNSVPSRQGEEHLGWFRKR
ncbi:MAG: TPMT family class I SAM-dependent methyltransferase [Cyanobacteria bacterium]|nr:TPMT family class I SAM-dependent methyltransferase [Cyanobacteriota bacterium]MDW8200107.1 methyltransferase domain-containing protein [Cyanobacteriota bacterium SKYGB_h_bin112]